MNLPRKRDHFESRTKVCFCCLKKDTKCLDLTTKPDIQKLVLEYVDYGYNTDVNSNPTGICIACKVELCNIKVIIIYCNVNK